jgi:hypothetical protein
VNLPPPENVPQGWYQDPYQPGQLRWWDGEAWTSYTQFLNAATPPATPTAKPQTMWTQQRTTAALILTAVLYPATNALYTANRSLWAIIEAGSIPLGILTAYLIWSALKRPSLALKYGAFVWPALILYVMVSQIPDLNPALMATVGGVLGVATGVALISAAGSVSSTVGTIRRQYRPASIILTTLGAALGAALGITWFALILDDQSDGAPLSLVVLFLGVYPLYKNISSYKSLGASYSNLGVSPQPTTHFEGNIGSYPIGRPQASQTPGSKYVAITLFSLSSVIFGFFIVPMVSMQDSDPAGAAWAPYVATICAAPFAIGGLIAWSVYTSKRRR